MKIRVEKEYMGNTYALTLESDVAEDLSGQNVEARVSQVLSRELQRCAEISAVAKKDKQVVDQRAKALRSVGEGKHLVDTTVGRGEPTFNVVDAADKGPSMTLGTGTKDPDKGRIVAQPEVVH